MNCNTIQLYDSRAIKTKIFFFILTRHESQLTLRIHYHIMRAHVRMILIFRKIMYELNEMVLWKRLKNYGNPSKTIKCRGISEY